MTDIFCALLYGGEDLVELSVFVRLDDSRYLREEIEPRGIFLVTQYQRPEARRVKGGFDDVGYTVTLIGNCPSQWVVPALEIIIPVMLPRRYK
jgi:hypothetical protein